MRNKAGATLTVAGRQFQRHASTLVRTVEQARHDVGLPKGFSGALVVGGRIGLWEEFLLLWVPRMQEANPQISIRAESALDPELMQGLVEGRIDIGVIYTPQSRPGLKVELLIEEQLVLVSPIPGAIRSRKRATSMSTGGPNSTPATAPSFPISRGLR